MPHVSLSPGARAFVADRVARFADEAPPTLEWLAPFVREHGALPLHVGWVATIGIRADGEIVSWVTEEGWPQSPLVERYPAGTSVNWMTVARVQGARRYPELAEIHPARPAGAADCVGCDGTGAPRGLPDVTCSCGGTGWVEG